MTTLCLQQICLLLLLASELLALDCDTTAENQLKVKNPEIQRLIAALGGPQLPQRCLYKTPAFRFPGEKLLKASKEDRIAAVRMVLGKSLEIFQHNITQAGWDARSLELLQNALYQQRNEWMNCTITKPGEVVALKEQNLNLTLRRYFRQIQVFLEGEQYSLCAWSLVRVEIRRLFFIYLEQLLNRF